MKQSLKIVVERCFEDCLCQGVLIIGKKYANDHGNDRHGDEIGGEDSHLSIEAISVERGGKNRCNQRSQKMKETSA